MDDEDDTQYMLAQDPGYALYMLQQEIEHVGNMKQQEHSQSLEEYMKKQEFEEEIRKEQAFWDRWDEVHGVGDEDED